MSIKWEPIFKDLKGIRDHYNFKDSDKQLEVTARILAILAEGSSNPDYEPLMLRRTGCGRG